MKKEKEEFFASLMTGEEMRKIVEKGLEPTDEEISAIYTTQRDVRFVDVHCHGSQIGINLGKIDNIVNLGEEDKNYIVSGGSNASNLYMFPDTSKKIHSIYQSVRNKRKLLSVWGSDAMNKDSFVDEFLPYLESKQAELAECVEYMEKFFDKEFSRFKNLVKNVIINLPPKTQNSALEQLKYLESRKGSLLNNYKILLNTNYNVEDIEDSTEYIKDFLTRAKKAYLKENLKNISISAVSSIWDSTMQYASRIDTLEKPYFKDFEKFRAVIKDAKEKCDLLIDGTQKNFVALVCELLDTALTEEYVSGQVIYICQALSLIQKEFRKFDIELSYKKAPSWAKEESLLLYEEDF